MLCDLNIMLLHRVGDVRDVSIFIRNCILYVDIIYIIHTLKSHSKACLSHGVKSHS